MHSPLGVGGMAKREAPPNTKHQKRNTYLILDAIINVFTRFCAAVLVSGSARRCSPAQEENPLSLATIARKPSSTADTCGALDLAAGLAAFVSPLMLVFFSGVMRTDAEAVGISSGK